MVDHFSDLLAAALCLNLMSYTHQPNPLWYLAAYLMRDIYSSSSEAQCGNLLRTEFSKVRVSGSSRDGFKTLKFLGSNLESSINSPVRISLTSLAGNSCTESIAGSVVEQFSGFTLIPGEDIYIYFFFSNTTLLNIHTYS